MSPCCALPKTDLVAAKGLEAVQGLATERGIIGGITIQFETAYICDGSARFDLSISYSGSSAGPNQSVAIHPFGGSEFTFRSHYWERPHAEH